MASSSPLDSITHALGNALMPLQMALADQLVLESLLDDLGWTLGEFTDAHFAELKKAFPAKTLEDIASFAEAAGKDGDTSAAIARLSTLVPQAFADIQKLSTFNFAAAALPDELKTAEFWTGMALELPGYLLIRYLYDYQPVIYSGLLLAGVIADVPRTGSRAGQTRQELQWDKLGALLEDPAQRVQQEYGWGGTLAVDTLQQRLFTIGLLLGAPVAWRRIPAAMAGGLSAPGHSARITARALELPFYKGWAGSTGGWMEAAAVLAPMADNTTSATAPITQMYLGAHVWGSPVAPVPIGDDWALTTGGSADVGVSVGPRGVAPAMEASAIEASVALVGQPKTPWILIGAKNASRLQLDGARVALRLTGTIAKPEVILELGTTGDGLQLVLDFSQADGFLGSLLKGVDFNAGLEAGISWSSLQGFTFEGSGTFEIDIPLSIEIGPLKLTKARIALAPGTGALTIEFGITGALELGPIQASADNVGLRLIADTTADPKGADGFGGLKLGLAFKPPDGVGLAIDAGPVSGGGYLYHDEAKGQYAGALELEFEALALTAVGLLATKMPDGRAGWALIAIISAEFPPINIGFGFTLNGVGGLLGVNRSVDTKVLQAGIKTHTLDSILFPKDVVANAPKILADLGAAFPATPGQYVFGPMLKIGWGTPAIITVDLGVVIELPDPIRVVLLGQIAALLPEKDHPLLELHIDVIGIADFESGELSIDASLYNSRLALYTLAGDMALRADFIGEPTFAMAVGGLNPRYPAPKGFPQLRRLSVSLDTGGNPTMLLEGYFGITSNSVQFGSRFYIYAEACGFSIEGETSFNVLVIFAPFQFAADLSFGITVRGLGTTLAAVRLKVTVSGPQPWRARGTAHFEIGPFGHDFNVDVTLPPKGTPALPEPAEVESLVLAAMGDVRNWKGRLDGGSAGVSLRGATGTQVLVHPAGCLEARQKVAPLATDIDSFGARAISGATRFDVTSVKVSGATPKTWTYAKDYFAPAQYYRMSDEQKLAGPDFETMSAGVALGDGAVSTGTGVTTPLTFETILVDRSVKQRRVLPAFSPRHVDVLTLAARGPAARAGRARSRAGAYALTPARVGLADAMFAVTSASTGRLAAQVGLTSVTSAAARRSLRVRPGSAAEQGTLHVVPAQEVVA